MSKSNKAIVNVLVHLISDALLIWTFCLHIEELLNWLESQYKRSEHCLVPEFNEITQVLFPHVWCWLLVSCMHHFFCIELCCKESSTLLRTSVDVWCIGQEIFLYLLPWLFDFVYKAIYMIGNVYWTTPVFLR